MSTQTRTAAAPATRTYDIGYTVLPSSGVADGTFTVSERPPAGVAVPFTCRVYDEAGTELCALDVQGAPATSSPITIANLPGATLTAKLNYANSGEPDVVVPLDLGPKGGLSALSGMDIGFTWYRVPDAAEAEALKERAAAAPLKSYLTGFDDHGMYYFLSYIPWIQNHWVVAEPPSQNDTHALSGSYSCQFNEGLFGQSYIDTIDLGVPSGCTHVVISFAMYMLQGGQYPSLRDIMKLEVYEGGSKTATYVFGLQGRTDINGWYDQQVTHTLRSASVSTFRFVLSLEPTGHLGGVVTVDNLAVNFMADPPAPRETLMIYGDSEGGIYGLDRYTGAKRWSFQSENGFLSSTVLVLDGVAYVGDGTSQANVYAIDIQTGRQIWKTPLPGSIGATPVVSGGVLIVGSSNGYLYALDRADGHIEWQVDFHRGTGRPRSADDTVTDYVNGIASDLHGVVYLATSDGVYATNVTAQQSLWFHPTPEAVPFAPALTEEEVVFGDRSGALTCLSKATGRVSWTRPLPAPINSKPYIVGGIVVIGTDAGKLLGYRIEDGREVWSRDFDGKMIRSFTIDGPYIYVAANDVTGTCYAYQYTIDESGAWHFTELWRQSLPVGAQCPPAVADGMVFYTASNQELYALSKTKGTMIWDFSSGKVGFATPAVVNPRPQPALSRRYDQVCTLVAHNAYANIDDGWWYAQQTHTIPEQLDMGARGLELDIYLQDIGGTRQIVYDHAGAANWLMYYGARWKLLRDSLGEIKTWMDDNPQEVVTLILEQGPGLNNPDPRLTEAFTDAGIAGYVFYANQVNRGPHGTWDVRTQGWPTLQWLVDNGKRLVVFSQKGRGNGNGFAYLWDYAVENEYGTPSLLSGCEKRAESAPLSRNDKKLFVVNYALNIPTTPTTVVLPSSYTITNNYYWLLAKLRACTDVSGNGRLPNLIKVNFFEYGGFGGPLQVVDQINREFAS